VDVVEVSQQRALESVIWTPENLSAGIYYFRFETGEQVTSGKVVLMK